MVRTRAGPTRLACQCFEGDRLCNGDACSVAEGLLNENRTLLLPTLCASGSTRLRANHKSVRAAPSPSHALSAQAQAGRSPPSGKRAVDYPHPPATHRLLRAVALAEVRQVAAQVRSHELSPTLYAPRCQLCHLKRVIVVIGPSGVP